MFLSHFLVLVSTLCSSFPSSLFFMTKTSMSKHRRVCVPVPFSCVGEYPLLKFSFHFIFMTKTSMSKHRSVCVPVPFSCVGEYPLLKFSFHFIFLDENIYVENSEAFVFLSHFLVLVRTLCSSFPSSLFS